MVRAITFLLIHQPQLAILWIQPNSTPTFLLVCALCMTHWLHLLLPEWIQLNLRSCSATSSLMKLGLTILLATFLLRISRQTFPLSPILLLPIVVVLAATEVVVVFVVVEALLHTSFLMNVLNVQSTSNLAILLCIVIIYLINPLMSTPTILCCSLHTHSLCCQFQLVSRFGSHRSHDK